MDNTELRKLQLVQLEIAKEIKRVCDKNNINYFLDAGSMLGAVRHKGFIPWDDDMDIGMLDVDYKRFLEIASKDLNESFFVDNYTNNPEYGLVFSKVKLKNTLYKEKLGPKGAKHQEIFVDIFPYFNRPNDNKTRKINSLQLKILGQVFMTKSGYRAWENNKGLSKIKFLPIIIVSKMLKKDFVYRNIEKLYQKCKDIDTNIIGVHDGISYYDWYYNKDYLSDFINVDFEGESFKIPARYDEILTETYGNYMEIPPVEERKSHEILELKIGDILEK